MGKNGKKSKEKPAIKKSNNKHHNDDNSSPENSSSNKNTSNSTSSYKSMKIKNSSKHENTGYKLFNAQLNQIGLKLKSIEGDGNCLFRSISDQLTGSELNYSDYRMNCCREIENNPNDFIPFIGCGNNDNETQLIFQRYLNKMKSNGNWGSNIELVAISRYYHLNIIIHQYNLPKLIIYSPELRRKIDLNEGINNNKISPLNIDIELDNSHSIHLGYHNEEHYSSVRNINDNTNNNEIPMKIRLFNNNNNGNNNNNNNNENNSNSNQPTLQEKIIMESTGNKDLMNIRNLLSDFNGDIDLIIEILINEREENKLINDKRNRMKLENDIKNNMMKNNGKSSLSLIPSVPVNKNTNNENNNNSSNISKNTNNNIQLDQIEFKEFENNNNSTNNTNNDNNNTSTNQLDKETELAISSIISSDFSSNEIISSSTTAVNNQQSKHPSSNSHSTVKSASSSTTVSSLSNRDRRLLAKSTKETEKQKSKELRKKEKKAIANQGSGNSKSGNSNKQINGLADQLGSVVI